MNRIARVLLALTALVVSTAAQAQTRTICTYDPAGKSGEYFKLLDDYALAAKGWGVDIAIKAYTDEETAANDYEAGQCDGVVATGVRLQRFNRFPSTIEAIGALPTYTQISLFSHHPAILPKGDVLSIFGPSSKLRIFHNLTHPWTQDLGEGTAERFLLGMKGILHRVPLQNLDIPMEEHFLPLDGGNVQLARNREGEKIVFLGGSEFRETEGFMVAAGITNATS